jgi:hypothetical protein
MKIVIGVMKSWLEWIMEIHILMGAYYVAGGGGPVSQIVA